MDAMPCSVANTALLSVRTLVLFFKMTFLVLLNWVVKCLVVVCVTLFFSSLT